MNAPPATFSVGRFLAPALLLIPLAMVAFATLVLAAYALAIIEPAPLHLTAPDGTTLDTLSQPDVIGTATLVGWLGMLLGAASSLFVGAAAAGGSQAAARSSLLAALLALLAVAFLFGRQYSYDSYYFPSLRRYGDSGVVDMSWLLVLAAGAIVALYLTRRSPAAACVTSSCLLLACAFTAVAQGTGH